MELLLGAVLIAVVLGVVIWPIIAPAGAPDRRYLSGHASEVSDATRDDLEGLDAAKEAKFREIRDAELDFKVGKLSEQEWKIVDAELRAEAIKMIGPDQPQTG